MDIQCPDALRILDFPHAAQAVSAIVQGAGMGEAEASPWLATPLQTLKHEGPAPVLAELARLCATSPLNEQMSKQYFYLVKREERMQYPQYQQDGWPIGSGIVESGNKVVIQARLKGAGMRFRTVHVNPIPLFPTAANNDRWDARTTANPHVSTRATTPTATTPGSPTSASPALPNPPQAHRTTHTGTAAAPTDHKALVKVSLEATLSSAPFACNNLTLTHSILTEPSSIQELLHSPIDIHSLLRRLQGWSGLDERS